MRLFGFTRTLEELDEIDTARVARALEALGYDGAFHSYARGDRLQGDEAIQAREMLDYLPDDIRRNVEAGRRDLTRGKNK